MPRSAAILLGAALLLSGLGPPNASGGPIWTVAGRYDFALHRSPDAWRIAGLTLTVQWATGNQQIMQLAASQATPS